MEASRQKLGWKLLLFFCTFIAAGLIGFILYRYWITFWNLYSANKEILIVLIFSIAISILIYCLCFIAGKSIVFEKFVAIATILVALITFTVQNTIGNNEFIAQNNNQSAIFTKQNQIDQQRITNAEQQTTENTIQSVVAITNYNCEIANTIVQSFQASSTFSNQFVNISYFNQPYINNLSFLSEQLGGKYNQKLIESIAAMTSANTLLGLVIGMDIQGSSAPLSAGALSDLAGYNQSIVNDSKTMQTNLCSSFENDLLNSSST